MTVNERIAYMKGVAAGMSIDNRPDGELLNSIINTLATIAEELDDINENALDLGEEIDAISDDLADVEEYLFDDEFYEDDDDFDFDSFDFDDDEDDFSDHSEGPCCSLCGDNSATATFTIDVTCPDCNAEIELNEDDIANESATCPLCNYLIELEIDEVEFDDDHDYNKDEADLASMDGATNHDVKAEDNISNF